MASFNEQALQGNGRWWTDDEAVVAWRRVREDYGPAYIIFGGMEPTEQAGLIGTVLSLGHAGNLNTNLSGDPELMAQLIDVERVIVSASFHPHLWHGEVREFVAQADAWRSKGFKISTASVVATPEVLGQLTEWVEVLRAAGLVGYVHPFSGVWQGQTYPAAYEPHERELLAELMGQGGQGKRVQYNLQGQRPQMQTCAAGWLVASIALNGTLYRCPAVALEGGGNFYRDFRLADGPALCPREACSCATYYDYHIPEGAEISAEAWCAPHGLAPG